MFANGGSTYGPANLKFGYKNDTNSLYLTFKYDGVTDQGSSSTTWRNQLSTWSTNGTPLTVMLAIRTKQTIQLTPNRIKPFLGQNSMSINTGDNLTVSYWKHN